VVERSAIFFKGF